MNKIKSFTSQSDTTEYHPYDPNLPAVFLEIKGLIEEALPNVKVEHVGSSSIPGVGGRNAIDIVIPAAKAEEPAIRQGLQGLGFQDSPFKHFLPLMVGVIAHEGKDYTILLYVISQDSEVYTGWIAFRNYMRTHPEDSHSYDELKQQSIAAGKVDGWSYQKAKTPFLVSITEKIAKSTQG